MLVILSSALLVIALLLFFALRIPTLNISGYISQNEKLAEIDQWLSKVHDNNKFNGTVLLSKHGSIVFEKSYGTSYLNEDKALNGDSSFNLTSVSKQFTAMGIVILNSRRIIDYDDEIKKYLPELGFYGGVTIRHLMHHTSGIPDYMEVAIKNRYKSGVFTTLEMIELYENKQPLADFSPGEKFKYSNAGYVLLAEIIARSSGKTFSEFLSDNIFIPLKMNNTQVFNMLSEKEPVMRVFGYSHKYWLFGGSKQKKDLNYFDGVAGDGGIYSSARDLKLWDAALNEGKLVTNDQYSEAYSVGILSDGSKTKYGFGWFINTDNTVEHSGGWQGFSSYIYRDLENQDLIIILDNSSNAFRVNSIGFQFNSIGINLKNAIRKL